MTAADRSSSEAPSRSAQRTRSTFQIPGATCASEGAGGAAGGEVAGAGLAAGGGAAASCGAVGTCSQAPRRHAIRIAILVFIVPPLASARSVTGAGTAGRAPVHGAGDPANT